MHGQQHLFQVFKEGQARRSSCSKGGTRAESLFHVVDCRRHVTCDFTSEPPGQEV